MAGPPFGRVEVWWRVSDIGVEDGVGPLLSGVELVMQESPPDEHAIGAAEIVVKDIKRQTRVAIFDIMTRYNERLSLSNPILFAAPFHGADRPLQCGRRWHYSSEQAHSKVSERTPALQLGEPINFEKVGGEGAHLDSRLAEGCHIEHHERTSEVTVTTSEGRARRAGTRRAVGAPRIWMRHAVFHCMPDGGHLLWVSSVVLFCGGLST